MENGTKIAILGAGHAGFAHAADLSMKGFEVRLYEVPEMAATIADIQNLTATNMMMIKKAKVNKNTKQKEQSKSSQQQKNETAD